MKKEYRNIPISNDGESRTIEGVCAVFNSWSEDLGFRELIHNSAITDETIKRSDIVMCFNHDSEKILARSKYGEGTLNMEVREDGVHISFDAPETQLGNDMLYHLRAGNLSSMSFAFNLPDDDSSQKWYKNEAGVLCREIFTIDRLWDAAIVINPAYEATSVHARSKELAEEALKSIELREKAAKEAEEQAKKDSILSKLNERMKNTLDKI